MNTCMAAMVLGTEVKSRLEAMRSAPAVATRRGSKMNKAEWSRSEVRQFAECLHGGKMVRNRR
jgi:hypothetical protein